jgi:glycosyltransferase involved in cell wall biosynthesis
MRPKVTIGVCVRNSAATLREAIESIICQDYPPELMEVIFVDDGSEDETLPIINSFIPRMNMNVKVFRHKWKGLGASRNVVVNNASGDYIIWVDGDMIIPKDHVRKQVEFMEKNPKVGIAKAKYELITSNSIVAALENIPFVLYYCSKNSPLDSKLPGTGGSIYRIEAVKEVDGFDNNLKAVGEDQDIAYRIMSAGWLIKVSDAFFFEREEKSWNNLWKKYVWYGYGNYFLYKKNKRIFRIYKMIPPTALLAGLLFSLSAFRLTHRRMVFLLPVHFVFKSTGWCWGFFKARFADISMRGDKNIAVEA